jgi:hypothetical protein
MASGFRSAVIVGSTGYWTSKYTAASHIIAERS